MTRARKPTMPKARLRWTGGDDRPKRPTTVRARVDIAAFRKNGFTLTGLRKGETVHYIAWKMKQPKRPTDADLRRWLRKARRVGNRVAPIRPPVANWAKVIDRVRLRWAIVLARDILHTLDPQGWKNSR